MPDAVRAIVWACRNLTPLVIATVIVVDSPSAIACGAADTANSATSLSSSTTAAEAWSADTV